MLRFSFGTMGSGKSTLALQIHHNLSSRQLFGLLLTSLDREGNQVTSRLGVAAPAIEVTPISTCTRWPWHWPIHYLVCDEAQFYTPEQCDQLARVVDELDVDVYAFGLHHRLPGAAVRGHEADAGDRRRACAAPGRGAVLVRCPGHAQRPCRQRRGRLRGRDLVVGDTEDAEDPLFGDAVRYELLCRRHYPRRPRSAERYFQAQGMRLMPLMKSLCR